MACLPVSNRPNFHTTRFYAFLFRAKITTHSLTKRRRRRRRRRNRLYEGYPQSPWFIPSVVSYMIKSKRMINQSMDSSLFFRFHPFFKEINNNTKNSTHTKKRRERWKKNFLVGEIYGDACAKRLCWGGTIKGVAPGPYDSYTLPSIAHRLSPSRLSI